MRHAVNRKSTPASVKASPDDPQSLRLSPASRSARRSATLKVNAVIASAVPFDEAERLHWRTSQLGGAVRCPCSPANPTIAAPMLRRDRPARGPCISTAGQRLRHIVADRLLPIRPGRRIGAEDVVAALGVVELDEGGAAIARMQLHAMIRRVVDHVGDADADRFRHGGRGRRDRRRRRSPCSRRGRFVLSMKRPAAVPGWVGATTSSSVVSTGSSAFSRPYLATLGSR